MPDDITARFARMAEQSAASAKERLAEAKQLDLRRHNELVQERWRQSGVLPEHRERAVDLLHAPSPPRWAASLGHALSELRARRWSALVGNRGAGKTQLLACLCRAWCEDEKAAAVIDFKDFCLGYRTAVLGGFEAGRLVDCARVPLYCVDGLESYLPTPNEQSFLDAVLDKRWARGLPTVFAANLKAKDFLARLGPSSASRFNHRGAIIEASWESFRQPTPNTPTA